MMREAAEINERKKGGMAWRPGQSKKQSVFRREPVLVISFVCAAAIYGVHASLRGLGRIFLIGRF